MDIKASEPLEVMKDYYLIGQINIVVTIITSALYFVFVYGGYTAEFIALFILLPISNFVLLHKLKKDLKLLVKIYNSDELISNNELKIKNIVFNSFTTNMVRQTIWSIHLLTTISILVLSLSKQPII